MILRLAVLIQYRRVTDRQTQTDRHMMTANTRARTPSEQDGESTMEQLANVEDMHPNILHLSTS